MDQFPDLLIETIFTYLIDQEGWYFYNACYTTVSSQSINGRKRNRSGSRRRNRSRSRRRNRSGSKRRNRSRSGKSKRINILTKDYTLKEIDQKKLKMIFDLRLVCRRFCQLERYLVKNIAFGCTWYKIINRLYFQNHSFWKKHLPFVKHLDLTHTDKIDLSMHD